MALVSFVGARPAGAAPCAPGTLQDYIDLGAAGCSAGDLVVGDFLIFPGQSFALPIDPTLVQVTPGGSAGASFLLLTFGANAAAGELRESFFHFGASAPQLVASAIAIAGASATGDGVVTAIQDVCPGGSFLPGDAIGCPSAPASSIAFLTESDSLLAAGASFAAPTFLDVYADVSVDGGLAGSAGLGSVTLSFTIPEPSTAALLVAGLALLARARPRAGR